MTIEALRAKNPQLLDEDDRAAVVSALDDLALQYAQVHEHMTRWTAELTERERAVALREAAVAAAQKLYVVKES
jgi:hypothetical protein